MGLVIVAIGMRIFTSLEIFKDKREKRLALVSIITGAKYRSIFRHVEKSFNVMLRSQLTFNENYSGVVLPYSII